MRGMTEAWLAFFHLSAVLGWIVFASAQSALCRPEWLNAAVLARLRRVDTLLWIATAAVLVTGLLRMYLGAKGVAWYGGNWLLHLKLTLFVVTVVMMPGVTRRLSRWTARHAADGSLPPAGEVNGVRRLVMIETHVVAVIPLAAVFLARGFGA